MPQQEQGRTVTHLASAVIAKQNPQQRKWRGAGNGEGSSTKSSICSTVAAKII